MAALGRAPCSQPAERGPPARRTLLSSCTPPVSGLEFPSAGCHRRRQARSREPARPAHLHCRVVKPSHCLLVMRQNYVPGGKQDHRVPSAPKHILCISKKCQRHLIRVRLFPRAGACKAFLEPESWPHVGRSPACGQPAWGSGMRIRPFSTSPSPHAAFRHSDGDKMPPVLS